MRNRIKYSKTYEEEGKQRRKELMKGMLEAGRERKQEVMKDLEETKAKYEEMDDNDCKKKVVLKKLRYLEDELEDEYKKVCKEKG